MNTEEFINKAMIVHNNKYNYDKVNYINNLTKVTITCPIHGDFKQIPKSHLLGQGCPVCARKNVGIKCRSSKEEFIEKAKAIHGDKYSYDKVNYVNNRINVIITCPIHGDFEQRPNTHLNGAGCIKCGGRNIPTTEEFIFKARKVHDDRYNYDKAIYATAKTNIIITCPIHGDFEQRPNNHLNGAGCPKCISNYIENTKSYIRRANKVHNNIYGYSKTNYTNSKNKITITCPIHGDFEQVAGEHMRGCGCPKCSFENTGKLLRSTTEDFIVKAKEVHGDRYDYSKTNYTTARDKVSIICKEHGEFLQLPGNHLKTTGCPVCSATRGEKTIANVLNENNIKFIREYILPETSEYKFRYDFYLPDYKILIEYHGIQHYKPINLFGGEEGFEEIIQRDKLKKYIAIKTGYKILYFNYKEFIFDKEEQFKILVIKRLFNK